MWRYSLLFFSVLLAAGAKAQRIDTLHLNRQQFLVAALKPGTDQYLVYMKNPKTGQRKGLSLWTRETSYSVLGGKPVIVINQRWESSDSLANRKVYSINDQKTFRPIFHWAQHPKAGIEAYNFYEDKIAGADTVANNNRKDFLIRQAEPSLNWELDIETFRMLPYAANKQFAINFYHPGSKAAPQFYVYKVIGSETVKATDKHAIDCWLLRIDYQENSFATFWISKATKEMIRMEEVYNGLKRYKIKLSAGEPEMTALK
ncbi:DUF3108 domain-containing protein [Tellurirhabdus bombi]|uniref:DUF3108 domain-containing protein n=1 Tax=Tellurirhabdus bombi TaxID=2907205 RepID=UPI001F3CA854|nr:hypothetical protein [Tellurirhabdus bombi]